MMSLGTNSLTVLYKRICDGGCVSDGVSNIGRLPTYATIKLSAPVCIPHLSSAHIQTSPFFPSTLPKIIDKPKTP